ncbi:MAG: alpha/beta hydrolase [Candidatus Lustribacter sp.]|jgi:pimeloyl-ACP methyl ester carboxylesterase
MPAALLDGISTRFEVVGSGAPLLMYAPGGFDARLEQWTALPSYAKTKLFEHLSARYRCIIFDRRETGASGGRIERVTWASYAVQGKALLDHLGIERAHVMGGCMGVSCAIAFGVAYPETALSLVLYSPIGGAAHRISSHLRFAQHLAYVQQEGLPGVVALVAREGKHFGADPRGGPWASVIKSDAAFAAAFAELNVARYSALVAGMARTMYDRDTAPGAEPEDLMQLDIPALVVPGHDAAHATSAARYLSECLARAEYWDVMPADQNDTNAPVRVLEFLTSASGG